MRRIIGLLLIIITGCNGSVYFTEPQPSFAKDLKSFPLSLQGKFKSVSDSCNYLITSGHIIKYNAQFRSAGSSQNDSVYNKINVKTAFNKYQFFKDTIVQINDTLLYISTGDTVFSFDAAHRIRKYKNYYFINTNNDSTIWLVDKLWLTSRDTLVYGSIDQKEEIDRFKSVTNVKRIPKPVNYNNLSDSSEKSVKDTIYILSPANKEFRKIARGNFFTSHEKFVRIR